MYLERHKSWSCSQSDFFHSPVTLSPSGQRLSLIPSLPVFISEGERQNFPRILLHKILSGSSNRVWHGWSTQFACGMFEIHTHTHTHTQNTFRRKPLRIRNISDQGVTGKHVLQTNSTRCTVLVNIFISLLYMFRATMCPTSGEIIVSMRHWYLSLWNKREV